MKVRRSKNQFGTLGFTLIEIMVVVVIIGLLAAVAIATFDKIRKRTRASKFANDCRVFAEASQSYSLDNGQHPTDTSSGALPDFKDYIRQARWLEETPIGGVWDVENNDTGGVTLMVGVDGYTITLEELTKLDDIIDDGNLSSGIYRRYGDRYYYVVED